jgi:hypothetical protein
MKIKLIALLLGCFFFGKAQETPVLFISEKLCTIHIDGQQKGTAENNNPLLLKLSYGEHYFQAKRDGEVFTQVIKCEDSKQKVIEIKLGQSATTTPIPNTAIASAKQSVINIMDNDIKLPGLMQQNESAPVQFFYSFDTNDTLSVKSGQNGESGTNNIFVYTYPQNQRIFFKERVNGSIEKFIIPQKGVYKLVISTNYFANKTSRLSISRHPSPSSSPMFNHIPLVKSDTTFTQLNDLVERLETNGFYRGLILPKNTSFWVYWIGIGEESKVKYDTFREVFSKMNKGNNANPLYAFGAGLINELPVYNNSNKTMDYYFTDNASAQLWAKGLSAKTYAFKNGKQITSDFGLIREVPKELNLLVKTAVMKGQYVNMKIGAFVINSVYTVAN